MKKIILLITLVLVIAAIAYAANVTVRWNAPTTYTDGTPLPLSDLSYVIGYGPVSRGTGTMYPTYVNVPTPMCSSCSYQLTSLTTGTWYASVRAVSNASGNSGEWSLEALEYIAGTPGVPTNVTMVIVSAS